MAGAEKDTQRDLKPYSCNISCWYRWRSEFTVTFSKTTRSGGDSPAPTCAVPQCATLTFETQLAYSKCAVHAIHQWSWWLRQARGRKKDNGEWSRREKTLCCCLFHRVRQLVIVCAARNITDTQRWAHIGRAPMKHCATLAWKCEKKKKKKETTTPWSRWASVKVKREATYGSTRREWGSGRCRGRGLQGTLSLSCHCNNRNAASTAAAAAAAYGREQTVIFTWTY